MESEHTYRSFLNAWKAAVENPENQIFSVSHYNVIDYILEYHRENLYERHLLTNIVNGLQERKEGNIIGELLNEIDPEGVSKLITIVEQSSFRDPNPILDTLDSIFNSLNSDKFIMATRGLIKKSIISSRDTDVSILIFNLVRILHQRYSTKYLKKLPEKTFTKAFLSPFKQIIIDNALTKNEIKEEVTIVLKDLLNLARDQIKAFNTNSRNDFFSKLFHNNTYWLKDRDNILTVIKKGARQSPVDPDGTNAVIMDITRRVCYALLRELMYEYTPAGNKSGYLYEKNYFQNLSTLSVIMIYNCKDDQNIHLVSFQDTLISNSLLTFLDLLSRYLCAQLPLNQIGTKLEILIKNQKSTNQEIDSFDFSLCCFGYIESVAEDVLSHVIESLQALQENSFDKISEFLRSLFDRLVDELSGTGMSALPTKIPIAKYHQIIDSLFDTLSNRLCNFIVTPLVRRATRL